MAEGQQTQVSVDEDRTALTLINIPSFVSGALGEVDPRLIPETALAEAVNCSYMRDQFFLGRPGLVRLSASSCGEAIRTICEGPSGTLYVAGASKVFEFNQAMGTFTQIATVSQTPTLLAFGNGLIICDGTRLRRYAGGDLFLCGSFYEGITSEITENELTESLEINTSQPRAGVVLTSSVYKRQVTACKFFVRRSETVPNARLVAAVYRGGTKVASSVEVLSASSLTTEYSYVLFTFEPVTLEANDSTYRVVLEAPGLTSGSYFIAIYTGAISDGLPTYYSGTTWTVVSGKAVYGTVNHQGKPAPTYGIVAQSRLFLTEGSRIWWSGASNPNDYSEGGGYFTFGDDATSVPKALLFWTNRLYVSGKCRGGDYTIVYDVNPISELAEEDYVAYGATCRGGLVVANETLHIVGQGWIASRKHIELGLRAMVDVSSYSVPAAELDAGAHVFLYQPEMWLLVIGQTGDVYVYAVNRRDPSRLDGPWVKWELPVRPWCFSRSGLDLLMGGDDGHLYKLDPAVNEDQGASTIAAQVTTKVFFGETLLNRKVLKEVALEVDNPSGGQLTLTVFVDGQEAARLTTIPEDDVRRRFRLVGRTFQFRFETTARMWLGPCQILFTLEGKTPIRRR